MRLTRAGLSVNELDSLVSPNAAGIVKTLIAAKAEQTFKPDEFFSQEDVDKLKADYINKPVYMIEINQRNNSFELSPYCSPFLPKLDLDFEKMDTPEFRKTLLTVLERRKESLGDISTGFVLEELTEIIEHTLSPDEKVKNVDDKAIRSAATSFAKDPAVINETPNATQAIAKVQEKDSKTFDESQVDFSK